VSDRVSADIIEVHSKQIAFALQQAQSRTQVAEVCTQDGVSEATFYRRNRLYGGLMPFEVNKLWQLEE
jgi:Transposase